MCLFVVLRYRLPPRSTRPAPLFPYPTPFGSGVERGDGTRTTARIGRGFHSRLCQLAIAVGAQARRRDASWQRRACVDLARRLSPSRRKDGARCRSEEHTSELPLMRISYAVFGLTTKTQTTSTTPRTDQN